MRNKFRLRADPFLVVFILLSLGASYWHYRGNMIPASATPVAQTYGHLVFAENFFDFGSVVEGDIVRHRFKFKNDGAGMLRIVKTETSCGCTTANGAFKEYAPGESGEMDVVVDTKGKKGIVVKTVTVTLENNDAATIELSLAMKLNPPPHPKIGNIRNINTEAACKSCHLESGEGQSGVFLYHRVCSQCHGKKGAGGFGMAHNDAKWQQQIDDARIARAIRAGLPEKGMPSFVEGVTPPLSEEQVGALIEYIRSLVRR